MSDKFFSLQSTSPRQQLMLIVGIVVILALTVLAFFWLSSEEYDVLFADLESRDAANVVEQLEQLKLEYRLSSDGGQILVPASQVHHTRLKLMGSDMPLMGGVGFELFDNTDFGMTEFAQRINYQRALEGELTRTIMSLQAVKYARVHLVMSEKGLFSEDDNPPSAAVTVFLKQGAVLAGAQIVGIQRLVASAVPSLKDGQVTVTDAEGVTLSRQAPEQKGVTAASARLQQKQAVEDYLINKVNEILARSFGLGEAMVSVDVMLNFSETKTTVEKIVPMNGDHEGGIMRKRETRLGDGKSKGGNVTTEIDYRYGSAIEQRVDIPGAISQLSVGLIVPADTSVERIEEIRQLVKVTVGLQEGRGDEIIVYAMGGRVASLPEAESLALETIGTEVLPASVLPKQQSDRTPSLGDNILDYLQTNILLVVVLVVVFLLNIVLLVLYFNRASNSKAISTQSQLTPVEREEVLKQLQSWLEQPDEAMVKEAH